MARHVSMRGEPIDFNKLQQVHSNKIALGNANMNAKGDIVTPTGIVLKTQEQIEAEWAANRKMIDDSISVDIKSDLPPNVKKALDLADQGFEPAGPVVTGLVSEQATSENTLSRKKKITESDQ